MKQERVWIVPVLALMGLGFALGACEYVVVPILPDIASGLNTDLGAVGKLVGTFAAGYAIGTPVVTAATGRVPRFRLLMTLLAAFLTVNALSMLAPSVAVLSLTRAIAAVSVGTLTAVALLFVQEVAPPERTAKAVAMIYTSMSLATVVGNPLNQQLSRHFGWRAPFALLLVIGVVLVLVLWRVLPHTDAASGQDGGFARQFAVLRDRRYALCAVMAMCCYAATYTVYTYLTPILTDILGVGESAISVWLLVVGLCCMCSNLLAGWLGERGDVKRTPVVFLIQLVLFAAMPALLKNRWTGLAAVLVMCVVMYLLSTPVQVFALHLAETDQPYAANLCASTLPVTGNIGIAIGSFASSELQALVGMERLGLPAAVLALAGLTLNLLLLRSCKRAKM